jgi:hypothetical protein
VAPGQPDARQPFFDFFGFGQDFVFSGFSFSLTS